MALDRQRILSELGSVMNQLKSADCGCMGKLFGNPGQVAVPQSDLPTYSGCMRGCCHGHGYGWNPNKSCDEPYSTNTHRTYSPCMGRCNPPKLYADTYNYLTENLMQPAVKEVYNDLKSLTPANTIVNNPMANQMGFTKNDLAGQGNMGDMSGQFSTNNQFNLGNMNPANILNNNRNPQANIGSMPVNDTNAKQIGQMGGMRGMGPQIMNMLGGNTSNQNNLMERKDQGPMVIDAPQSAQSHVGVTPLSTSMNNNHGGYKSQVYASNHNINQSSAPSEFLSGKYDQNMNTNPATQQMAEHYHPHGQHSQGIAKFNEMFPGVMKGLGGDLGFDPMAIAIQMNPANHQQAAMDTMHKMMQNNDINKVFDQTANSAVSQSGANAALTHNIQQNRMNEVLLNSSQKVPNDSITQNTNSTGHMDQNIINYKRDIAAKQDPYGSYNTQANMQQICTAGTANQQPLYHEDPQQIQQTQQQSLVDPNTGRVIVPPTLPVAYETVTNQQNIEPQIRNTLHESTNVQQVIKEPIYPADTSRYSYVPPKQKYYEYNTLGQPVEMLSAKVYRTPEPALPQTLSPQPTQKFRSDPPKYSKVKSTVSKTSIMGNKPIGKTPSQLQQIYNQYKGSQSYTQRNIATPSVKPVSHSEGKLNSPQVNSQHQQMPVEKVGGDTMANNQMQYERTFKVEKVPGHIGDVLVQSKICEGLPDKDIPLHNRKCRNGLQDIVYTSYPSSAAWSFHGANTVPCATRYRYRK